MPRFDDVSGAAPLSSRNGLFFSPLPAAVRLIVCVIAISRRVGQRPSGTPLEIKGKRQTKQKRWNRLDEVVLSVKWLPDGSGSASLVRFFFFLSFFFVVMFPGSFFSVINEGKSDVTASIVYERAARAGRDFSEGNLCGSGGARVSVGPSIRRDLIIHTVLAGRVLLCLYTRGRGREKEASSCDDQEMGKGLLSSRPHPHACSR